MAGCAEPEVRTPARAPGPYARSPSRGRDSRVSDGGLPRVEAPEGWVKKVERAPRGKSLGRLLPYLGDWTGSAPSLCQRARRLGQVIRFARCIRAEDARHEIPPTVFGSESRPRPVPYIFSTEEIKRILRRGVGQTQPLSGAHLQHSLRPTGVHRASRVGRQSISVFRTSQQTAW